MGKGKERDERADGVAVILGKVSERKCEVGNEERDYKREVGMRVLPWLTKRLR